MRQGEDTSVGRPWTRPSAVGLAVAAAGGVASTAVVALSDAGAQAGLAPGGPLWNLWIQSLLLGFVVGALLHQRRESLRDVERLAPALRGPLAPHRRRMREASGLPSPAGWAAAAVGSAAGMLLVTGTGSDRPFLLSEEPWSAVFALALALNALIFALLGAALWDTGPWLRAYRGLEEALRPLHLLDPAPLAPFGEAGLRAALLWIGGSSIASLLFLNLGFSVPTGIAIAGTLAAGSLSFWLPIRRVRQRTARTKAAELARVRAAIARTREGALSGGAGEAAALTGLLAWEARVEAADDWPLALPTLTRFGALVALGIGSWIGAALVERVLDAWLA